MLPGQEQSSPAKRGHFGGAGSFAFVNTRTPVQSRVEVGVRGWESTVLSTVLTKRGVQCVCVCVSVHPSVYPLPLPSGTFVSPSSGVCLQRLSSESEIVTTG